MKAPKDGGTGNLFGDLPKELAKAEGSPVQATIGGTWERATTKRNPAADEADRRREAGQQQPIRYEATR